MLDTARINLESLKQIVLWNHQHNIHLFRITSQLIPFGSHPVNSGIWKKKLQIQFQEIGKIILDSGMRVSMHPGQYTVLNSPTENTYQNALADLDYHSTILDSFGLDHTHRIVLHGGGGYGNKEKSLQVLAERIKKLPQTIYMRLSLENDDVVFTAEEILKVCMLTKIPGVLDVFHHRILPGNHPLSITELIDLYKNTWSSPERQKIHYSNQNELKLRGAHADSISVEEFNNFYSIVKDMDLDIMLEVKDKEQSLLQLRQSFPSLK